MEGRGEAVMLNQTSICDKKIADRWETGGEEGEGEQPRDKVESSDHTWQPRERGGFDGWRKGERDGRKEQGRKKEE